MSRNEIAKRPCPERTAGDGVPSPLLLPYGNKGRGGPWPTRGAAALEEFVPPSSLEDGDQLEACDQAPEDNGTAQRRLIELTRNLHHGSGNRDVAFFDDGRIGNVIVSDGPGALLMNRLGDVRAVPVPIAL